MAELRTCFRCSYETNEVVAQCPKCGQRLRTSGQVRRLGVLQLLIGLFLVGLMGTITFMLAPAILRAGEPVGPDGGFTGTPQQALLILGLFGLVIAFGLGSMLTGLWQIKTGRRNKWLFFGMLALFVLVVLVGWIVKSALGG